MDDHQKEKRVRIRGRKAALDALVMYMMEKGKLFTRLEYSKQSDVPLRIGQVDNYFGNWSRLVAIMENDYPDAWKQLHAPEPEPAPKPEPALEPAPADDPLAALSKAAPAEKSED